MDKVKYWLDLADYDYATAGDLMRSKYMLEKTNVLLSWIKSKL